MSILSATRSYEHWLGQQIETVSKDLNLKHHRMAENPFTFFRATYYRWLQRALDLAPELNGPVIAAVGDLHVENFGVWRNGHGERVWGINDFDESESLPYALDLARLATSASLAIESGGIAVGHHRAYAAILRGYRHGIDTGGAAFVLDGTHQRLAEFIAAALRSPAFRWRNLAELPLTDEAPVAALTVINAERPPVSWEPALRVRVAGAGSLGHRRLIAIGTRDGTRQARELKQLSPPAGQWLGKIPTLSALDMPIVRSPDPLAVRAGGWITRPISPDCVKLGLQDLRTRGNEERLLEWMGRETANIHLGTVGEIDALRADLAQRSRGWLHDAADRFTVATKRDWSVWTASRA